MFLNKGSRCKPAGASGGCCLPALALGLCTPLRRIQSHAHSKALAHVTCQRLASPAHARLRGVLAASVAELSSRAPPGRGAVRGEQVAGAPLSSCTQRAQLRTAAAWRNCRQRSDNRVLTTARLQKRTTPPASSGGGGRPPGILAGGQLLPIAGVGALTEQHMAAACRRQQCHHRATCQKSSMRGSMMRKMLVVAREEELCQARSLCCMKCTLATAVRRAATAVRKIPRVRVEGAVPRAKARKGRGIPSPTAIENELRWRRGVVTSVAQCCRTLDCILSERQH